MSACCSDFPNCKHNNSMKYAIKKCEKCNSNGKIKRAYGTITCSYCNGKGYTYK